MKKGKKLNKKKIKNKNPAPCQYYIIIVSKSKKRLIDLVNYCLNSYI